MKRYLLMIVAAICCTLGIQAEDELIISFKTNAYVNDGEENLLSMAFGSNASDVYIDIDTGYGSQELEVGRAELEGDTLLVGSPFEAKVSEAGEVRIYGDPTKIDYFNASGCAVTEVYLNPRLALNILNLEHNELQTLNLEEMKKLQVVYLMDNPFTAKTPLYIGRMESLRVLEVGEIEHISPDFTLQNFPALVSFDAYYTRTLTKCDPTGCPYLVRLSLDMTNVESVDVSQNPELAVLNVSDTKVTSLDLSSNTKLQQLYINHSSGTLNKSCKFESIDLSACPQLYVLFAAGNNLRSLDLSKNKYLHTLSVPNNLLESVDLSRNTSLYSVNLANNKMDFATLPLPQSGWYEYYYYQQDMKVRKVYKTGDVIDLGNRVVRAGTETTGGLYYVEKNDPTNPIAMPEDSYELDLKKGTCKLLKTCSKDMCLIFENSTFSEYPLYTTQFTCVTPEEYAKPKTATTISTTLAEGEDVSFRIGVEGATKAEPKTVYVDFGDGETMTAFTVESETPDTVNVRGKRTGNAYIRVYTGQEDQVTALSTSALPMSSITTSGMPELRVLELPGAGLYIIDLGYNPNLQRLDLSGNNFSRLSLKGGTYYYYKSSLADVNLSHNHLDSLLVDDMYSLKHLDISYNRFSEIDFSDADNLLTADLSHNLLEEVQFNYSEKLQSVNLSDNNLTSVYIPEEAPLEYYNVSGNKFTLINLPSSMGLDDHHYIYAPQQPLVAASKTPAVNLSEYRTIDGVKTVFTWKKAADGTEMVADTDYKDYGDGSFRFMSPVFGQDVYCEMTNMMYPQFQGANAFRTAVMTAIDTPQFEVASFTTLETTEIEMSLAADKPNTSVFIDWNDNGLVEQYLLGDTYKLFTAKTKKNKNVRVLVSSPDDNLKVMSIYGVKMKNFSCNKERLTKLVLLGLEDNGLTELNVPQLPSVTELKLGGNELTDFDFSKFPNLYYLSLNDNELESIDLSQSKNLGWAYLGNNKLREVKFGGNDNLESLDLGMNQLTETPDFTEAPNIGQLWLFSNKLTDVSNVLSLDFLRVLNVTHNNLTIQTLPLPQWQKYDYDGQADLEITITDGKADLTSQVQAQDGTETLYRWFIGRPEYNDDTEELEGEELILDEEYSLQDGLTTFLMKNTVDDLVCVMTNEALPDLTLYTKPATFDHDGIEAVIARNPDATVRVYTIDGMFMGSDVRSLAPGIYVVKVGRMIYKVRV